MRYAEATFVDRNEDTVTMLFAFRDSDERSVAEYDFKTFNMRNGLPHEWHAITRREAERRYDIKRLDIPAFLEHCTIHDYRRGPLETRQIWGIEESAVYEAKRRIAIMAREHHISEARAARKLRDAQPTLEDVLAAIA